METMTNGVMPVFDMARNDDGTFGENGIWFLLLLFLFAGRGFGWGGNEGIQDNFISGEFIKRDIFNTNQNVSGTACQTQRDVIDSRYTTQLGLQDLAQQMSDCCCRAQKETIENRYTTQLGLQNLGQQMSACCCDLRAGQEAIKADAYKNTCEITTAIHAEGEATRALINAQAMQDLRDKLADRDRELMSANLALQNNAQTRTIVDTLQPTPKPAYNVPSPYMSYGQCGYGCGCGNI